MTLPTVQYALVAVLILAAVGVVARFEMFCLRDLAHTGDADLNYLTRAGWIAVIAVVIPLGGIAYLYCGKRS